MLISMSRCSRAIFGVNIRRRARAYKRVFRNQEMPVDVCILLAALLIRTLALRLVVSANHRRSQDFVFLAPAGPFFDDLFMVKIDGFFI